MRSGDMAAGGAARFPLPQGEGGERKKREPGEGLRSLVDAVTPHPPSFRSGTLSPWERVFYFARSFSRFGSRIAITPSIGR